MSSSSFPSMSMALGGNNPHSASPNQAGSFIRLSPTAFFNLGSNAAAATSASSSPLDAIMKMQQSKEKNCTPSSEQLIATPKSHHRRTANGKTNGSASSARKKLCYPEESVHTPTSNPLLQSNRSQTSNSVPRQVCFIPKFIQSKASNNTSNNRKAPSPTTNYGGMKKNASQPNCQSAPIQMYDNFSSTNVYATPPRHSLRRQQSASATMVSVGSGRYLLNGGGGGYRSNTAFVRFTPPIGDDVSTLYAGSKFSDSPSAKSLPMPPTQWLEDFTARASALNLKSSGSQSADMSGDESVKSLKNVTEEDEEVTSDDTGVVFDLEDGKCSSPSAVSDTSIQMGVTTEEEVCSVADSGELHPKLANILQQSTTAGSSAPTTPIQHQQGIRIHPLQLIAAVIAS